MLLVLSVSSAFASGYFDSLSITPIAQEENYYCGVTVVQMWIDWLHGSADSQDDIAADQGVTSSDGLNSNEMADALEDYSSHWFSDYSRSTQSTFAMKIVSEINGGSPAAVVANTRRRDGTTSANQHWLLVDSFWESSSSYSTSYSYLNGFYMNDPLYGSAYTGTYYYISPTSYISKSSFFSTYISTSGGKYYLVED